MASKVGRPAREGEVKPTTVYLGDEQRDHMKVLMVLAGERRNVNLEFKSDAIAYSLQVAVEQLSKEPMIKKMATRPVM